MSKQLEISDFINNKEIAPLIKKARELKDNPEFIVSDIVDDQKNQYVDLVQEGGGVLGIALLGYTCVLEESGIRFFDLAGTSAGSINTMLLASLGNISIKKTEKILNYLKDQNLFDFVDGDKKIKALTQRLIDENYQGIIWKILYNVFRIKKYLTDNLGFNPGDAFENWMKKILNENRISSSADLTKLRKNLPNLKNTGNNPVKYEKARTAIITADVTTKSKVQFPQMAHLYWPDVNSIHPAKFVRASMSIPFFFEPFEAKNIPNSGLTNVSEWYESVRYKGEIPKNVKFVDGGLISNFPINVFHVNDRVPYKPTFGVRLSAYRDKPADTSKFSGFLGGMISTMRQLHDLNFLLKHDDYSLLICNIDADKKYNWLDFNMKDEDKIGLFNLGAQKAMEFLDGFRWDEYKKLRKSLLKPKS